MTKLIVTVEERDYMRPTRISVRVHAQNDNSPRGLADAWRQTFSKWNKIKRALERIHKTHPDTPVDLNCGGAETCGLCGLYLYSTSSCKGCPIEKHTCQSGCVGTPNASIEAMSRGSGDYTASDWLVVVYAEIDFLGEVYRDSKK